MTTADFIKKTYNTKNDKWGVHGYDRHCSSVFTDRDGNVYSYGYHYPLAFNINGLDFVNTNGYSSTTNRHIMWAKQAIGYDKYIGVKLRGARLPLTLDDILSKLGAELVEIKAKMDAKKRKDTQVYKWLQYDFDQVKSYYDRVRKAN